MANDTHGESVGPTEAKPSTPLDPHDVSLIEQNLRLTPEQRMEQLVRIVRFIQAGRAALARKRG